MYQLPKFPYSYFLLALEYYLRCISQEQSKILTFIHLLLLERLSYLSIQKVERSNGQMEIIPEKSGIF